MSYTSSDQDLYCEPDTSSLASTSTTASQLSKTKKKPWSKFKSSIKSIGGKMSGKPKFTDSTESSEQKRVKKNKKLKNNTNGDSKPSTSEESVRPKSPSKGPKSIIKKLSVESISTPFVGLQPSVSPSPRLSYAKALHKSGSTSESNLSTSEIDSPKKSMTLDKNTKYTVDDQGSPDSGRLSQPMESSGSMGSRPPSQITEEGYVSGTQKDVSSDVSVDSDSTFPQRPARKSSVETPFYNLVAKTEQFAKTVRVPTPEKDKDLELSLAFIKNETAKASSPVNPVSSSDIKTNEVKKQAEIEETPSKGVNNNKGSPAALETQKSEPNLPLDTSEEPDGRKKGKVSKSAATEDFIQTEQISSKRVDNATDKLTYTNKVDDKLSSSGYVSPDSTSKQADSKTKSDTSSKQTDSKDNSEATSKQTDGKSKIDTSSKQTDSKDNSEATSKQTDGKSKIDTTSKQSDSKTNPEIENQLSDVPKSIKNEDKVPVNIPSDKNEKEEFVSKSDKTEEGSKIDVIPKNDTPGVSAGKSVEVSKADERSERSDKAKSDSKPVDKSISSLPGPPPQTLPVSSPLSDAGTASPSGLDSESMSVEEKLAAFLSAEGWSGVVKEVPVKASPRGSQQVDKRECLYKILVIGELGTGKTSIIKRYVHQFFSQHYRATIGVDFALKVINWDPNTIIRLQLWDIAGQERFGNMTRVYYKEAVGAFIVFDVTRSATFDAVLKWKQDLDSKVQLADGSSIPCVLLANKCDQQKEGIVNTPAKMDEYCKDNNFSAWFETSAKENINIDEAAKSLVSQILQNDKMSQNGRDSSRDSSKFPLENKSDDQGRSCAC